MLVPPVQVFQDIEAKGIPRTDVTYAYLIQALMAGDQWNRAAELYRAMQLEGLVTDRTAWSQLIRQ